MKIEMAIVKSHRHDHNLYKGAPQTLTLVVKPEASL